MTTFETIYSSFTPPREYKKTRDEVFAGISRNKYPSWEGWVLIDLEKDMHGKIRNPELLFEEIEETVKAFYKRNFYSPLHLSHFPKGIAELLYSIALNNSVDKAARVLQRTINALSNIDSCYKKVEETGLIESITLYAFYECMQNYDDDEIIKHIKTSRIDMKMRFDSQDMVGVFQNIHRPILATT